MATEVRMTARILALIFIYVSTCVACMILGGSVWQRTEDAFANLRKKVARIWGRQQTQLTPTAHYTRTVDAPHQNDGNTVEAKHRKQVETVTLPLQNRRVNTDLTLENR